MAVEIQGLFRCLEISFNIVVFIVILGTLDGYESDIKATLTGSRSDNND